jgi:foldase protein PrsA
MQILDKGVVCDLGKLYVNRKFRFPIVLLGTLLVMFALFLANGNSLHSLAGVEPVVLTVNDEAITQEEFYARLEEEYGTTVLEQLVMERLISQAGATDGFVPSEASITQRLDEIKSQYPSEESFLQTLAHFNISMERLRQDITLTLTLEHLATKGIELAEGAVADFYEAHKYDLGQPEMVEAHHIVVDDKQEAEQILKELKAGADFAEMAKKKSTDYMTVQTGGALGWVAKGQLPEAFEAAAFALKEGELSQVVETYLGYHVIKVTGRKEATPAQLDDALTAMIEQQLKLEQADIGALLAEMEQQANITVNWNRYKYLEKIAVTN